MATKKRKKNNQHKRGPRKPSQKVISSGRTNIAGFSIETPQELQIQTFVDESGLHAIQKVNQLQGETKQVSQTSAEVQSVELMPPEVTATLVSIATNAWRAKNKMVDIETGEPKEEMRRVFRHVEGIFNSFDELGFVVTAPSVGKAYDTGMALKVICFEEMPGVSREEITETIKPSVTWRGRLLQIGEVIVGTPVEVQTSEKENENE
jgi:hypothetical protein